MKCEQENALENRFRKEFAIMCLGLNKINLMLGTFCDPPQPEITHFW